MNTKVIVLKTGSSPKVVEIEGHSLPRFQELVGGDIEAAPPVYFRSYFPMAFKGLTVFMNEMPGNQPLNSYLAGIRGPVVVTKTNAKGEDIGLSEDEIDHIMSTYGVNDAKSTLKDKLDAFCKAAIALSNAWNDVIDEDPTQDPLTEAYPFDKDFEEVIHQIIDWKEKSFK